MKNNNNSTDQKPTIAIIGAGIFGINAAIDLGEFARVTLFERKPTLLTEGSFINQFRHHMGYHYPRSPETVIDIQNSSKSFEERYGEALVITTPTYYGIAKDGSRVDAKSFLNFCDQHNLPYNTEKPEAGYLNEEELSLIIKVPEASYHYTKLIEIANSHLNEKKDIEIQYNASVIDCKLLENGKKKITVQRGNQETNDHEFDFVINATYAHLNSFTRWLNLKPFPIRIDLAEVLIVKIPGPLISLTIMDGPFATIMPTGNPNEYTLYHVEASIIDQYTPDDGLVKPVQTTTSRRDEIMQKSLRFFPFLKNAEIVTSRIVHRGVLANHEHDDSRVANIIEHGNGCWSILSGKILSSVQTAKRIAKIIKQQS